MSKSTKARFRFTRDGILFVVGISGIIYETLNRGVERPTLLLLFAGMVGLTQFLRSDENRDDEDEDPR